VTAALVYQIVVYALVPLFVFCVAVMAFAGYMERREARLIEERRKR
jgi:hypothetical protein